MNSSSPLMLLTIVDASHCDIGLANFYNIYLYRIENINLISCLKLDDGVYDQIVEFGIFQGKKHYNWKVMNGPLVKLT